MKLTRKASLVAAASALPKSVQDVKETMLLPGYIANVTNDACYVRFLNQLTGRAGLAQLADLFVSDPSRHYHVNQSVKAQVVQVSCCTCKQLQLCVNSWMQLCTFVLPCGASVQVSDTTQCGSCARRVLG